MHKYNNVKYKHKLKPDKMKTTILILSIFWANFLWAQQTPKTQNTHKPFTGDVLTIAVTGKEDCQLPGSVVRGDPSITNLNKLLKALKADNIGTGFVLSLIHI